MQAWQRRPEHAAPNRMPSYSEGRARYWAAYFRRLDLLIPMTQPLFIRLNMGSGQGDAFAARATIELACNEAGRDLHCCAAHSADWVRPIKW